MKRTSPTSAKVSTPDKREAIWMGLAVIGGLGLTGWLLERWLTGGSALAAVDATTTAGAVDLQNFAFDLRSTLAPIVYIAAVAAIVAGGIIYMFSGGDPAKVKMAKGVITAAISGVVLYMFMYWLINWLGSIVKVYFKDLTNI